MTSGQRKTENKPTAAQPTAETAPGKRSHHAANKVASLVLACAVVCMCVACWLLFGGGGGAAGGEGTLVAVVHDSDGKTHELPLDENATLTVETSEGRNVVSVQDGAVSVVEADCENHDCMHQGALSAPGAQIVCLPHKLWIEVVDVRPGVDNGADAAVDADEDGAQDADLAGEAGESSPALDAVSR